MAAIDDFNSIGLLVFKISQSTGEPLALRVTTEGLAYSVEATGLNLTWDFPDAASCLAFLQALDGDPTAQQAAVKQAKIDALNDRIARDQAAVEDLS